MSSQSAAVEALRDDALAIWKAGLQAVDSQRLVAQHVVAGPRQLRVADWRADWDAIGRIAVVGAGKAGAGMAAGLEQALGPKWLAAKQVRGWVNVPEDCVRPLQTITLHAARPAGVNEPTAAGVAGAARILQIVESLGPQDLCICLLSGGGSALLPAPAPGVTLADKQKLTRLLSGAGANIQELNTVRKQLSQIKGGGLARRCRAGQLLTLVISDVLGDPLDVIASGPTTADHSTPRQALAILERFGARDASPQAWAYLQAAEARQKSRPPALAGQEPPQRVAPQTCRVQTTIIGNNATAVAASANRSRALGYATVDAAGIALEGAAEQVAGELLRQFRQRLTRDASPVPRCLISGGEPTVHLAPADRRGRGGRNQQLVLEAMRLLLLQPPGRPLVLLSGGTDGEDGPTDAAGAWIDSPCLEGGDARLLAQVEDALARNDAYPLFQRLGRLIQTGPTHTNVCDLRIIVSR